MIGWVEIENGNRVQYRDGVILKLKKIRNCVTSIYECLDCRECIQHIYFVIIFNLLEPVPEKVISICEVVFRKFGNIFYRTYVDNKICGLQV